MLREELQRRVLAREAVEACAFPRRKVPLQAVRLGPQTDGADVDQMQADLVDDISERAWEKEVSAPQRPCSSPINCEGQLPQEM